MKFNNNYKIIENQKKSYKKIVNIFFIPNLHILNSNLNEKQTIPTETYFQNINFTNKRIH